MTGRSPAFTADMPKNQARSTGLVMPRAPRATSCRSPGSLLSALATSAIVEENRHTAVTQT